MKLNRTFVIAILVAITLSLISGLIVGELSVSDSEFATITAIDDPVEQKVSAEIRNHKTQFLAAISPGSHLPSILLEIEFAHNVGISEIILETALPWSPQQSDRLTQALKSVINIADDITVTFALDCNPPQTWLRENPDDASTTSFRSSLYPSVGSKKWLDATTSRIQSLIESLKPQIEENRITGFILQGLENGQWVRTGATDTSVAHHNAFREWVTNQYPDGEALREAWNDETIDSPDAPLLPLAKTSTDTSNVLALPKIDQQIIDYNAFINDATTSSILTIANEIHTQTDAALSVFANHPNVLEFPAPAAGSWGGMSIVGTTINGIVTQLHSKHRQLGQHGYYSAPIFPNVNTLSLDGTYSGIAYDTNKRTIKVPGTFLPDHMFNLLARNAIISALSGTMWVITDHSGSGEYAHEPLWNQIDKLLSIRHDIFISPTPAAPKLAVVIDESSAPFINDSLVYNVLFESVLDTLTHCGIEFTWLSIDSLIKNPPSDIPVYLFVNLFNASSDTRQKLHARLAQQKATAIWLYAAGYIDETPDVANVSALTGIATTLRDTEKKAGSRFVFSGTWIEENQDFGVEQSITPTFTSTDEYADPLARYRDDESISAAMKYLEDGWTSIAIFEPTLTSQLLRDLFYILEVPHDVSVMRNDDDPVVLRNANNLLLYCGKDTTVNLEFETSRDIVNLLNAKQGWTNARAIAVHLNAGETALLALR